MSYLRQEPAERFRQHLSRRPYCSNNPHFGVWPRSREVATSYAYIQPNAPWRHAYITLDLDRPGAAFAAEEVGLPIPTFSVVNPVTAHAHLLYELEYPVFPERSQKADWLLRLVTGGLSRMLESDPAYTGTLVQNPLHHRWHTIGCDNRFTLDFLAEHILPHLLKPAQLGTYPLSSPRSRNCDLFDKVRLSAYKLVKLVESKNCLYDGVYQLCQDFNAYSPPLPTSELRTIARSISSYTWRCRFRLTSASSKNRGILGFEPIIQNCDYEQKVKNRRILSAHYARSQRSTHIDAAVQRAIEIMTGEKRRLSVSAVARQAGVSRSALYARLPENKKLSVLVAIRK